MKLRTGFTAIMATVVSAMLTASAAADVLCKTAAGSLVVRNTCKKNETQIFTTDELGLETPSPADISARVFCSTNISVASGPASPLPFDSGRWDTAGIYDAAQPDRLTAPLAGKYLIFGHVRFAANPNGDRSLQIALKDANDSNLGVIAITDAMAITRPSAETTPKRHNSLSPSGWALCATSGLPKHRSTIGYPARSQ